MRFTLKYLIVLICGLNSMLMSAQTTSWRGVTSTNWTTASNWTSGVPTSTVDAIIGDANFTGAFQPILNGTATCKNLTIGTGTKASTLNIVNNITVWGNFLIGSNGTITANTSSRTITLKGNWTNQGVYSASPSSAAVTLSGSVVQTITGSTTFRRLNVNANTTLLLANSITVNNTFNVNGTVNPTSAYLVNGTGNLSLGSTGTLLVYTATFAGNYALSGSYTINRASTVNYASASLAQTVSSSFTYGKLRISGGSTKSLAANLPGLSSTNTSSGFLYVDAGTFDLKTFTANRSSAGGGGIVVAAGAKLMIGGTNGFPVNYTTISLASTSTVEYYGNNQTVLATTYGHLTLKATSGAVTKTMPATALTIAGNFTTLVGTGTSLSATAAQAIIFNGIVDLGPSTTFNGGSFSHQVKSNWINNGTFNGSTSTLTFSGIASSISGSGTNNFNNLSFTAFGITGSASSILNVAGNLSTTTPGLFTHADGGQISLTGTTKTLSGNGFVFSNLNITGSISSTANFEVKGNFTNSGSFAATAGDLKLSGTSAQINGSSASSFYSLIVEGTITTSNSFTLASNLSVSASGSFTASAGTATFNGTSTIFGKPNLFNVTVNATRSLILGSSSELGIAGTFTQSGTFNVSTYTPNAVNYNKLGAQAIASTNYNNLILSGSGTKTPASAITVNNDFTIQSGVTFNASSFVFSLYRHWINNGTFVAASSDVQFRGSNAATITGASTFNDFTVNKTASNVRITLSNDITANNVVMTQGYINTDNFKITTTSGRSGNGIIIGTVVHSHSFANATPYSFEGPNNLITFNNPSGITSVSVTTKIGEISDFDPDIESIIREYEISVPAGTYTSATLRMHYENNELNAFSEPFLSVYKHNTGLTWDSLGYTSRDTGLNYVERTNITSVNGRFSASGIRNIVRWNGSVSTAWNNASNWTTISGTNMANRVPTSTDAAQLGVGSVTNQPTVSTAHTVSVLRFGSDNAVTLTINGGNLNSSGSMRGQWSNVRVHTINVSSGVLNAGTNLLLSDGITGHEIQLNVASGSVIVNNDLIQSAGQINFTGTGNVTINGDYNYTGGNFYAGSGTVIYTGGLEQNVANVDYNHLTVTKTTSTATINHPTVVNGNLTVNSGGELIVLDTLTVLGDFTISSSTLVESINSVINLQGNWTRNGTFIPNNGKVVFDGTGTQTVNNTTFNDLEINKASGSLLLNDNIVVNGNLHIAKGTFDLDTFNADRSFAGGVLSMDSGSVLLLEGATNFPDNYNTNTLNENSEVIYAGTVSQSLANVTYGDLTFSNGASNAKSLVGNIQINGDLKVNAGASFNPNDYSMNLFGNFTNSGNFIPGNSTLTLNGVNKTIAGATTFNNLSVILGSYTVSTGTITMTGDLFVENTGSLNFGTNTAILDGDLTNKGMLSSNGTATFTGTRLQTLQLLNAISSSSTGVINFNGTVAPVINSSSSPSFATVNINNTDGITASVPWSVFVGFNVANGATFNGGAHNHRFYGQFTNNGTVTSDGLLKFTPGAPYSASATIKLDGVSFASTGEVEFGGTAPITLQQTAPQFNIVNITNTNAAGVTAPGSWTITDQLLIGNNAIFKAGSSTTIFVDGSITNNGTYEGQTSVLRMDGAPSEINGTGTNNFNHFVVESAADLTLNASINVQGNMVVDGTFIGDGRTVAFTGFSNSTISGAAASIEFGDLEQNKTSGYTSLSSPITITGELSLLNGKINTTATNYINMADNSTASSGSNASFVNGPMRKTGDDAFVFPVGKGTKWARLGISAPSNTTDAFTAEYFDAAYSNTSSMSTATSPALNNVSIMEYWDCARSVGSSAVTVQLFWENTLSGINNYSSDLVVAHWDGSAWENKGQTSISGGITGSITSTSNTSFSPFTFGSLSPSFNPLPITLLNFDGKMNANNDVDLNWRTVSETNNKFFTVERSSDGVYFTPLVNVEAAGNSNAVVSYQALDANPYTGYTYYRLKQTDLNGKVTYAKNIVSVYNVFAQSTLSVYPNPSNGIIQLDLENKEAGVLSVKNSLGEIVFTIELSVENSQIDLSHLPAGIYILSLETGAKTETCKFIKN